MTIWTKENMKDEKLIAEEIKQNQIYQQKREKDELAEQLKKLISHIEYYYGCGDEGKREIYKEIEKSKNLLNRINQ